MPYAEHDDTTLTSWLCPLCMDWCLDFPNGYDMADVMAVAMEHMQTDAWVLRRGVAPMPQDEDEDVASMRHWAQHQGIAAAQQSAGGQEDA